MRYIGLIYHSDISEVGSKNLMYGWLKLHSPMASDCKLAVIFIGVDIKPFSKYNILTGFYLLPLSKWLSFTLIFDQYFIGFIGFITKKNKT